MSGHSCAGCGIAGRPSLADPPPNDPRPLLILVWVDGRPVLLCDRCREAGQ